MANATVTFGDVLLVGLLVKTLDGSLLDLTDNDVKGTCWETSSLYQIAKSKSS